MSDTLKQTPLHDRHVALGARMVPFAGWAMPVQYPTGITEEHRAVRERAGLFDVSHMGEFEIRGPEAEALIQKLTVNDVTRCEVWQAQYSALTLESGGIIDDLIIYRFPDHYMLVVNAANLAKDRAWIERHAAGMDVAFADRSDAFALLALQGPAARAILAPLADVDLEAIGYYRFARGRVAGLEAVISATGYTGEDGFELYLAAADAPRLWDALLAAGAGQGLAPAGLGARDSLRLEVGYALYGNDLDEDHTPLESALAWITRLDAGDFLGRDALLRQKADGIPTRLVGLRLTERGFPRPGYRVLADGRPVGVVTSGTSSPTLGAGIALARVEDGLHAPGTALQVEIRGRGVPAVTQRPPFYTGGSIRR
ncbi:MAG: glycine cleavage system aminomethyltransferase GcvT [Longimicrobiales bacterium]|nr:glycine cleavage system aminomethyltransferase GcvT [Longimicrobiales bacterium]